jgi:hypothetical protein
MTSDFAASVRDLNTSQVALEKLSTQIKDVDNKNLEAAKALSDALTALEKRAADLQSQLGEVSGPLKLISFKPLRDRPFYATDHRRRSGRARRLDRRGPVAHDPCSRTRY